MAGFCFGLFCYICLFFSNFPYSMGSCWKGQPDNMLFPKVRMNTCGVLTVCLSKQESPDVLCLRWFCLQPAHHGWLQSPNMTSLNVELGERSTELAFLKLIRAHFRSLPAGWSWDFIPLWTLRLARIKYINPNNTDEQRCEGLVQQLVGEGTTHVPLGLRLWGICKLRATSHHLVTIWRKYMWK